MLACDGIYKHISNRDIMNMIKMYYPYSCTMIQKTKSENTITKTESRQKKAYYQNKGSLSSSRGDLSRFWLSCLGPLVLLLPKL